MANISEFADFRRERAPKDHWPRGPSSPAPRFFQAILSETSRRRPSVNRPAAVSRAPLPKLACAALQMLRTHARIRLPLIALPCSVSHTRPIRNSPVNSRDTRGGRARKALGPGHIRHSPTEAGAQTWKRGWRVLHSPTLSLHGCRQPLAAATSRRVPSTRWSPIHQSCNKPKSMEAIPPRRRQADRRPPVSDGLRSAAAPHIAGAEPLWRSFIPDSPNRACRHPCSLLTFFYPILNITHLGYKRRKRVDSYGIYFSTEQYIIATNFEGRIVSFISTADTLSCTLSIGQMDVNAGAGEPIPAGTKQRQPAGVAITLLRR